MTYKSDIHTDESTIIDSNVAPMTNPFARDEEATAQSPTQFIDFSAAPSMPNPASEPGNTTGKTGLVFDSEGVGRPPWATTSALLREYYDTEWGMPVRDEAGLFERLTLEGFQSGLSWATVLRKRDDFRIAFAGFNPDAVAAFGPAEVERMLNNPKIIRNRRKIEAAINNANATIKLREKGGLSKFIWSFMPEENLYPRFMEDIPKTSEKAKELSKALKKEGFTFVGPVTCHALMEAIGMFDAHLIGSHRRGTSGVWDDVV